MSKFDETSVVGRTYVAAARILYGSGLYTAWRVLGDDDRPHRAPATPGDDGAERRWVLLWMDDNDAINPTVTAAQVYDLKRGEQS